MLKLFWLLIILNCSVLIFKHQALSFITGVLYRVNLSKTKLYIFFIWLTKSLNNFSACTMFKITKKMLKIEYKTFFINITLTKVFLINILAIILPNIKFYIIILKSNSNISSYLRIFLDENNLLKLYIKNSIYFVFFININKHIYSHLCKSLFLM